MAVPNPTAPALPTETVVWRPQAGPQKALIDCPIPEVFFGGSRGGGKTDGILGKWALKAGRIGSKFNAVFFRKEMPQQDDLIERSRDIFAKLGAGWLEQKKTWIFPNGARVRFRPLETVQDAEKYQGQNLSDACVEEAGNYPTPAPIDRLFGCLRGGPEVQLILTANPGGPGHQWIKSRYIDPAPMGMKVLRRELPNGGEHRYVYIPSRVKDNQILLANDPNYVNRLYLVGSDALVKAWLEGDWNVVEGAFFDCWSTARHVVRPFTIPEHWLRFRSMDWGSASPFSVGWWAVVSEPFTTAEGQVLPRGCLVRYREWYGASAPNVGLRLTAEEVAKGIKSREAGDKIAYGVLDPSAFAQDGGPSIAERMFSSHGVKFRPADNTRVAMRGRMGGWDAVRSRMKGDEGGRVLIAFFATCIDTIRTVPVMQHDPNRAEDLDTHSEDHALDDVRYACTSRPWTTATPTEDVPLKGLESVTLDNLWKDMDKRNGEDWRV